MLWQPPDLAAGGVVLVVACVVALFPHAVTSADPMRTGGVPLQPPSSTHPLGTDELGRDLWSNLVHGTRTSLAVGVLATTLGTSIGVAVGAVAGYHGGFWDEGLMRLAELVQIVPRFLLALLLVALFGSRLSVLTLVIAATTWPVVARVVRSEVLSLRQRDFVVAARAVGARDARVIARHLLPNALPAVLIGAPVQVGRAIVLEAGLSFLGLGDRATASWGSLLQSAQSYLRDAWWLAVFPGGALTLVVLALFGITEGLHRLYTPGWSSPSAPVDGPLAPAPVPPVVPQRTGAGSRLWQEQSPQVQRSPKRVRSTRRSRSAWSRGRLYRSSGR
ncbi:MAG: ABC transporter permease [Armatimonadota bacterium]|nr:ABC transporter permease [Armatimonadota bacterium]